MSCLNLVQLHESKSSELEGAIQASMRMISLSCAKVYPAAKLCILQSIHTCEVQAYGIRGPFTTMSAFSTLLRLLWGFQTLADHRA
jgi:hypothetical protein